MPDADAGDAARPGTPDTEYPSKKVDEARMKADALEREHLAVTMQRRHDALREELKSAREALEKTTQENARVVRDAEAAREALEAAKKSERARREECERATRERDEARNAKRELLDANDRKDRERESMKASMDGYVRALEAATEGKNKAEAAARKATADSSGATAATAKLESEVRALKEHNAWLTQELEAKSQAILTSTKTSSAETLRLAQELERERNVSDARRKESTALKEQNAEAEAKLSTIEAELRQLRADMARAEANFEKELITAQRISEVSKELVTERDGRIKELEASLSSTEALLDAKKVEFDVALAEAKHAQARAEKDMDNMKKQASESVVSARESRRSPHAEQLMHLSPAAGSVALQRDGLSATDLYTKYVEAEDALRVERTERAILQEHLDAIMFDLEKKAPLLTEQQEEYQRALKSHQVLQSKLQESENARYAIQVELNAANMNKRDHERLLNGFKAQSADLARQVALLLNEVNELKGCPPVPIPAAGNRGGDAQAVITSRLVDFTDIQSLQAKNQEMLFVIRELSEAQEAKSTDAREEYEQKLRELKEQTSRQLEELSSKRVQQENMVQAIVRQRDMYKTMYAAATGGGNGDGADANDLDSRNSELVAIGSGSGVAMMETNNELVALNKELSHDLEKLKRESADRIKELQQQVDNHREAAATARGEANAAKASAEFERQRYKRLSEQFSASRREVETLTERSSALSRENASNASTLRTQAASLDASEERARNAQTLVSKLESENALLIIEQTRLTDIVNAAEEIKTKLEASRDSALALSTTREEEHQREYARLTDEVARLQQDYSRVRSELDIERERARQQLAAHAAASSDFAQRAKADVDASATLKEQTAEAEKRADIAEAKLEMMQATLEKTEDKLRLASRMTGTSEANVLGSGAAGALTAAREQELLQAALKAGEAADEAKAAAEAEKLHTAQFKNLAQQSDAALKDMTKAFEKHKAQSAKEASALKSECAKLKAQVADAAKAVDAKLAKSVKEAEDKVAQYSKLESEMKSVRAELERAKGETKAAEERAAKAVKDVEDNHTKWRDAQSLYENEVAARKADAEKISAAESAKASIEKALGVAKDAAAKAERELAASQAKVTAEKNALEAAKRDAESKLSDASEQNKRLHDMLEKSKTDSAGDAAAGEGEVLRYLRQERDAALAQVTTLTTERNKWQRDAEVAMQEAASAKERVKSSEASAMGEEKHKSLMKKVEQLNAIEQSNSALRAEIDAAKADIAAAKSRESELGAKHEATKTELAEAKAAVAAHDTEMETVRKEAKHWEQRASLLVGKYGDVETDEQGQSKSQMEEALAEAQAELKAESARAEKAKSQLAISMKHIRVYNPDKIALPEWQKKQKEQSERLAELEAATKAAISQKKDESDVVAQLATAKKELDAANEKVKSATEKAERAEKALGETTAEVEKLRENIKKLEEEVAKTVSAPTEPVSKQEEAEDAEEGETAAAPPTPTSDRFKVMAQKMQAEAMEAAKKLRETEDMLKVKEQELAAALNDRTVASEKCASLQKELDGAREKLKLADQLRSALEAKLAGVKTQQSAPLTQATTPLAELASKAKDFVPTTKPPAAPVPFAVKTEAKKAPDDAAEEKQRLQAQMDALRKELDEKKAAASLGTKRKVDDVDVAQTDEAPTKTRKTDADSTPAPVAEAPVAETPVVEVEAAAAADDDDGDDDDDNDGDDDAEEGELEDVDDFVEQLLVDDPSTAEADDSPAGKSKSARDAPGADRRSRGRASGGRTPGGRRPQSNRQRNRSAGRGGRGGRGKKN